MREKEINRILWEYAQKYTFQEFCELIKKNKFLENVVANFLEKHTVKELELFFGVAKVSKTIASTLKFMRLKYKEWLRQKMEYRQIEEYEKIQEDDILQKIEINFILNRINPKDLEFMLKYVNGEIQKTWRNRTKFYRLKKKYFILLTWQKW